MNTPTLGTEPGADAQRDAIHQAIIPAVAGQMLRPGQRVEVEGGEAQPAVIGHGIVDPYLTDVVPKGQRFWLCLLPGTVTGMRHHWAHPDFEEKQPADVVPSSEEWLRDFSREVRMEYEDMITRALAYLDTGKPIVFGDDDSPDVFWNFRSDSGMKFWDHIEIVTGRTVHDKTDSPFCCAC